MKQLWEIGYFMRVWRSRIKYGELSRSPLRLLRVEVRDQGAQCDWWARLADPWDHDLPSRQSHQQLASDQALRDAIAISELLFDVLPEVRTGVFRAFRRSARELPELIISGKLRRDAVPVLRTASLAMQAKLHGFHFWLDEGVLVSLSEEAEEEKLNFITK